MLVPILIVLAVLAVSVRLHFRRIPDLGPRNGRQQKELTIEKSSEED